MLNPREIPFIRWLLPFLGGILLAIHFDIDIPFLKGICISLLSILLFAFFQRGWYRYGWILTLPQYLFFVVLGYLLTWNFNELHHPQHFKNRLERGNFLIGKISSMPLKKKWIRVEFSAERIGGHYDSLKSCEGTVLVYLERDTLSESLGYGDLIGIQGNINEIEAPKNPHAFNYKHYLHFQNIHHQSFVKKSNWVLLEKKDGYNLFSIAINLRIQFLEILRNYLSTKNEFSVGSALILGYKDEISEETRTAYADTGAMHVLAVSGLHVGIIYLILQFFLLNRIHAKHSIWKAAKIVIPLLGIWAFALITGMPPSVKRAATMFSFFIIGQAFQRNRNPYNILAASAFWLLCINPFLLMQVGFQLSYFAVIGIVYFQPKLAQKWVIKNKIGNYFWQLVCVSIAAQLVTFPLGLYYFHQFPIYFWLSGLVVVPAAFLILLLGILLFLLEAIVPGSGAWVGIGLQYFIEGVNWVVFFIGKLPGSVVTGVWLSAFVVLLIYVIIGQTAIAIYTKKIRWAIGALSILTFISLNYSLSKFENYQNRKITIYNIYKHTAIDFFDGGYLYHLKNERLREQTLNFAVQNNRWASGVKKRQTFFLEDSIDFTSNTLFGKGNFFQFYDKKLAIIGEPISGFPSTKLKVDYLLIQNNPKIDLQQLFEHFELDLLIFDASNAKWRVEKWKEVCTLMNVPFYDINEEGAWVLDLNNFIQG